MKRIMMLLAALLLAAALPMAAFAEDRSAFDIDIEGGDWSVIMRDVNEAEYAGEHGLSAEDVHAYLVSTDTYIDAVSSDMTREITVRKTDTEDGRGSYLFFSPSKLSFEAGRETGGILASAKDCEYLGVVRHPQTNFLVFDIEYLPGGNVPDRTFRGRRYVTMVNGGRVSVELFDYADEPTEEELAELEKIVMSISFDSAVTRKTLAICGGSALLVICAAVAAPLLTKKHRRKKQQAALAAAEAAAAKADSEIE